MTHGTPLGYQQYGVNTNKGIPVQAIHKKILLEATPLNAEAFRPFGKVVEHSGVGRRNMIESEFSDPREGFRQSMWMSRLSDASTLPLSIDQLERHPFSHQAFIPLLGQRYLVVCCPDLPDGNPNITEARAFVAAPHQGVIYRRNVWHAGLRVLDAPAEFVVVMALNDGKDDELLDLDVELHIERAVTGKDGQQ